MRVRVWAAIVALGVPSPAAAQWITISPIAGVYRPPPDQGGWSDIVCPSRPPCYGIESTLRLSPGPSVGFKVAFDLSEMLRLEMLALTATSRRTYRQQGEVYLSGAERVASGAARNTTVALRGMLFRSLGSRADLAIGLGPSVTWLSGASYDAYPVSDPTRLGVALAATFRVHTSPGTRLAISAASNFYSVAFTSGGSFRQHDLTMSANMEFVLPP